MVSILKTNKRTKTIAISNIRVCQLSFGIIIVYIMSLSLGYSQDGNTIQHRLLKVSDNQTTELLKLKLDNDKNEWHSETVVMELTGINEDVRLALDGKPYSVLTIPGCSDYAERVGLPMLPTKGFYMEVPYDVNVSLNVLNAEYVNFNVTNKIMPQQAPVSYNSGTHDRQFVIDNVAYAKDSKYPGDIVKIAGPTFMRNRRVVYVSISPTQYDPATGNLLTYKYIKFRLEYKGKRDPDETRRKIDNSSDAFEVIGHDFILNYEPLPDSNETSSTSDSINPLNPNLATANSPLVVDPTVDYLIITADAFYDAIQPLAQWKTLKGYRTRVTKISTIGNNYDAIHNYIWTLGSTPKYVLLVGDYLDVASGVSKYYSYITTDFYYACSYRNDISPMPSLALGRLSVHTVSECTTAVNKILKYDRNPDQGSWYNQFITAGFFDDLADDGIEDDLFMESSKYTSDFLKGKQMTDHQVWTCLDLQKTTYYHCQNPIYDLHRMTHSDTYPSADTALWQSNNDAATTALVQNLNAGVGFVLYNGHGLENAWAAPILRNANVNSLSNGTKTPVVINMACLTGKFDWTTGDCFCEALIKNANGGAVGTIGASDTAYMPYADVFTYGLLTGFWADYDSTYLPPNHSKHLGDAMNYGKYYLQSFQPGMNCDMNSEVFHLFGDPEMELRTASPQPLDVSYTHLINTNQYISTTVNITVKMLDLPVKGARVAITDLSGNRINVSNTDSYGVAHCSFSCQNAALYNLVVTYTDAIPFVSTLAITSAYTSAPFYLKNGNDPVFVIDDNGNLHCSGPVLTGVTSFDIKSGADPWIVKYANLPVAVVDKKGPTAGRLQLGGSVYPINNPSASNPFYVKITVSGISSVIADIDLSGNLYLHGQKTP